MIEILEIQLKCKLSPMSVNQLNDFDVQPGGLAEPDLLLRSPQISPYCLDDATKRAIFVETPAGVDITTHPFLCQAQYETAQRLFAVPYTTMVSLAEEAPAGPVPLVLIYSPGRSGSTLLSKAFQAIGTVTSLSEPDIYTQIVALRAQDRTRDAELTELLMSATKLHFKPVSTVDAMLWVIKLKSFCIEVADLLHAGFPAAKSIFLYRGLRDWTQSNMQAFAGRSSVGLLVNSLMPYIPLLHRAVQERAPKKLTLIEVRALHWLSTMQRFVDLSGQGVLMQAIRYEDMVANPRQTLSTAFGYIGIDERWVDTAVGAFSRDSQEGSVLSRKAVRQRGATSITEAEWERVRKLLRQFPLRVDDASQADLVATNTII